MKRAIAKRLSVALGSLDSWSEEHVEQLGTFIAYMSKTTLAAQLTPEFVSKINDNNFCFSSQTYLVEIIFKVNLSLEYSFNFKLRFRINYKFSMTNKAWFINKLVSIIGNSV